jgi:hypothetical protein
LIKKTQNEASPFMLKKSVRLKQFQFPITTWNTTFIVTSVLYLSSNHVCKSFLPVGHSYFQ